MNACPYGVTQLGVIRDVLGAVDCNVQAYAVAGYKALDAPGSPLPAALTIMLTIYVAVLGYRLIFAIGAPRLSDMPIVALQVGTVLALTLNWGAFQTVVFDVAAKAPMQIARVISRPMAQTGAAAGPLADLQADYDELVADSLAFGRKAGPAPAQAGDAAGADILRKASNALLASTAGILAVVSIATGVLTAVGPIFVTLFLFESTRGFFVGWLRALVGAMLAPMLCWITTSLLLVVIAPWMEALRQQRLNNHLLLDTAVSASMIVMVFAAAQVALVVAGVLVGNGFRLGRRGGSVSAAAAAAPGQIRVERVELFSRAEALTRRVRRTDAGGPRQAALVETGGPGDGGERQETPGTAIRRPLRLGESYRRGPELRDRLRASAAGRS